METNSNKLIVVLGMHRSGTSVIARGLKVLGAHLGNNLDAAGIDNPRGYWEDLDINALNVEMLNFLKNDWHFLTPIQSEDVDALHRNGYFLRAVEMLRKKMAQAPIFGFKDPRVAKLLPFWKKIFAHGQFKTHYILAIRHPLSVIKSLAARNGFELEKGYLLWLEHVINSFAGTEGESCVVIDYDRLMQSPGTELAKVAKEFQLQVDNSELEKFKLEFLDDELRHTVYQLNDLTLDEAVPPLAQEVYSKVLDIAADRSRMEDALFKNSVKQWSNELSRLRSALVLADKLESKIAEREQVAQALSTQVAEINNKMTSISTQLNEREQVLQALNARLLEIYGSRTWRIGKILRKIRLTLMPPNSLHVRIGRRLYKIIASPRRATVPAPEQKINPDISLINESDLFDGNWYLTNYIDVAKANFDPALHYLLFGGFEGRDPSLLFNSSYYLATYPDVKKTRVNPLVHYLRYGKSEGRAAQPEIVPAVSRDPILVYQMGKVGSKTVELSLLKAYESLDIKVPIHHVHILNDFAAVKQKVLQERPNPTETLAAIKESEELRQKINENADLHWNIVTLVRDPVARNVAMLFQNSIEFIPDWRQRYADGKLGVQELQEWLIGTSTINEIPNQWFDMQIKQVRAFGIDVYAEPFPKEIGYKIYPGDSRARLLLIRLENLNECAERAMHEFLGLENFTLHNTNLADDKEYADLYRAFKNQPLPVEYVQRIYNTQVARHFYTEAELLAFAKRWTGMDKLELARDS